MAEQSLGSSFFDNMIYNLQYVLTLLQSHAIISSMLYQVAGKNMRKIRKKRGMTQEELAKKLGTNQRNISMMESGSPERPLLIFRYIDQLLEVLKVPADRLFRQNNQ